MGRGGAGIWNGGTTSIPRTAPSVYSDLGVVDGGQTVAAGTVAPAIAGRVKPLVNSATPAWIRITGTAAKAGDAVYWTYEGRRTAAPDLPAARIGSAAGPGAPGTNVLADGTIELGLSNIQTDGNYLHWYLRRPAL